MRRYKYSSKKKIIQSIVVIFTLTITAGSIVQNQQLKKQLDEISRNENISQGLSENTTRIYVANTNLPAGTILTERYFSALDVDTETVDSQVINIKEVENKQLIVDLKVGEEVHTNMITEVSLPVEPNKRYVEHTFLDGAVPSTLPPEQINRAEVDIMLFKEGEADKVVVERATIIQAEGNKVGFHLSYEDMVKLKQAASEGYLYLAFYLDKNQENDVEDNVRYQLPYLNN